MTLHQGQGDGHEHEHMYVMHESTVMPSLNASHSLNVVRYMVIIRNGGSGIHIRFPAGRWFFSPDLSPLEDCLPTTELSRQLALLAAATLLTTDNPGKHMLYS